MGQSLLQLIIDVVVASVAAVVVEADEFKELSSYVESKVVGSVGAGGVEMTRGA